MSKNPSAEDSVTEWLDALKANQSVAAQQLWNRYISKLVRLASVKLRYANKKASDEDDIVGEVFRDFLSGVSQCRFPRLNDRDDLWQVLTMLTERKVIGQMRRQGAAKRGQGKTRGESVFEKQRDDGGRLGFDAFVSREPDPALAAQFSDTLAHLLSILDDKTLEQLARDQLAGHSQEEMAERNEISIATVQRKLRLIREKWGRAIADEST